MKTKLNHKFVDFIPEKIEPGVIYISFKFATAVHLCACGCGNEVVTPISPSDWSVKFNGQSITLDPSIGNWSFTCRSHYWIDKNKIIQAPKWNQGKVKSGRRRDKFRKKKYSFINRILNLFSF
ncbi:DUF6527 family protein [Marinifilum flexuosum]|uniref:DUF6527 family protein n=1 Tax=Marinifilum flexuosum TaxID=1117708 RepID=UPI00249111D6|nr:DUF6527 family protein [Marinifilum flexuosum]